MDISGIIKDSLRYPFTDWKNILILGIIVWVSSIIGNAISLGYTSNYVLFPLICVGFITGLFVNGYMFKIIKTSLNEENKPPEFNAWTNMLIDGMKVFLVSIVYLVVPILIIILLILLLFTGFDLSILGMAYTSLESTGINPAVYLVSETLPGIENIIVITLNLFQEYSIIFICILLLIIPIFLVAIAHMAYYEGELRSAFRIKEIIEEISDIGWINLIKWYIVTGIIFLIFMFVSNIIAFIGSFLNFILISTILSLTLIPYFYMFYARTLALFYMME
ncbi:DUF4013 domain-containing protein [Methanobacterium spitsbergense]|uniref:DUF4013 domain-containing protein n=1 Tax=Methanobacterium spitsbergense TaxID=2874285 RepID=A0A8T5UW97_9EURY|nr:DUF4013 domain-containing protein [Methanobacterium spitsbergense]MBZ2166547.1 DUF4013 domain-containing protein [Methanobacterium spitsbergense]